MSKDDHKHDLEFNKLAAGILFAGVLAMTCTFIANALYKPKDAAKRGYEIEVPEGGVGGAGAAEVVEVNIAELLATADAAAGEASAKKKCASCHTFEKGGANKVGPYLWNTYGSAIGKHASGYPYSKALAGHGGVWDDETLNAWLKNPQKFAKGSKMVLRLKKDQERANIIKYLKTLK